MGKVWRNSSGISCSNITGSITWRSILWLSICSLSLQHLLNTFGAPAFAKMVWQGTIATRIREYFLLEIWKYKSGWSLRVRGTVVRSLRCCQRWGSTTVFVRWGSCNKEENTILWEYKWHAALIISGQNRARYLFLLSWCHRQRHSDWEPSRGGRLSLVTHLQSKKYNKLAWQTLQ